MGRVRDEPVAERAVRVSRDETILPSPTGPVGRVERVEVEHPAVPIERIACGSGGEAVHGTPAIREPSEEVVPATAVAPVEPDVQLRERSAPMRKAELPRAVPGLPRRNAEVGLMPLPPLDRPVRAVSRRARADEPRQSRPPVRAARVSQRLPSRPAGGRPASRVVDPELRLRPNLGGETGVQSAPRKDAS